MTNMSAVCPVEILDEHYLQVFVIVVQFVRYKQTLNLFRGKNFAFSFIGRAVFAPQTFQMNFVSM